jgi:hypothetical protein
MLGDVAERMAVDQLSNRLGVDAELPCEPKRQLSCARPMSYLANLVRRQLRSSVAALLGHVGQVVSVRTDEEMRRITAGPVVARVADERVRRERAVGQFIGHSMRSALATAYAHSAVSGSGEPGSPFPACIRSAFVNACPEAIGDRKAMCSHATFYNEELA